MMMSKEDSLSSIDVFVDSYSKALLDYLTATLGKDEKYHIQDLSAHTASFAEACFHTINNFT